jgi:3-hydroxyacyl-CoA dehydrogenase / enoyl-CoA hydratase / 3-hydroxybutyryl-CoA epimerase
MDTLIDNDLGTLTLDGEGVATLTLAMAGGVNKINDGFGTGLQAMLEALDGHDGVKGVIVASAHRDWCVGADIDMLFGLDTPAQVFEMVMGLNRLFSALEALTVPVVAALTGSALGGGYELALACHHRIAVDDPRIQLGLPEVMLGVIPGAGGTQRLPRLIGIQPALELMAAGARVRAPKAIRQGLVDALAPDADAVMGAARAWIAENPRPKVPWLQKGFRFPAGVQPQTPDAMNLYTAAAAMLYKRTAGALRAPEVLLQVVQEGCRTRLDRALEREARAFAALATSGQARDMMRTLWYHKNAADKHEGLPTSDDPDFSRIAVLGAGMMGGGLAFICAKAGYDVVLRDITQEALDAGMDHIRAEAKKLRHLDADARQALLDRITPTLELAPVQGADLVIEAVVENLDVKHTVIREVEPLLAEGAVFASNTSALPITDLAGASAHPDRFIGLHYFSPVEKMPLIEIIRGEATSDATVGRCLAFAKRTRKTPIVVNDGYAFYTTRLFSSYTLEGVQLVAEGHEPAIVEWAARTAGMVVGPLQVFDEVTLTLGLKAMQGAEAYGYHAAHLPGVKLLDALVNEHGRKGRAHGAGFYDYDARGRRQGLWSGLARVVEATPDETGIDLVRRRLMLVQAAEVGRVLDDGILQRHRDAEVGAILGLGFAPGTGGPLSWMQRQGLPELVAELEDAAARWGERYAPSATLRRMADSGEVFFER